MKILSYISRNLLPGAILAGRQIVIFLIGTLLFSRSTDKVFAQSQNAFVTVWNTDLKGYGLSESAKKQIVFPGAGQNYDLTWMYVGADYRVVRSLKGSNTTTLMLPYAGMYVIWAAPGAGTFHGFKMAETEYVNQQKLLKVEQWGNVKWTSMASAFEGCAKMEVTATDIPDLSAVNDMSRMFSGCRAFAGNATIANWNTTHVTDMSYMFGVAEMFNQPIGSWDTGNVTNMAGMFNWASKFNQPIGGWNTMNVTDMSYMFSSAKLFNQPINSWDTGKVTNMAGMFQSASNFNQPIGGWNTTRVADMSFMFSSAYKFNQPIGNWDTGNVTTMESMFYGIHEFNQPIGSWDVRSVRTIRRMFMLSDFNQPLDRWNTANITDMLGAFGHNWSFNQPIGNWNTSNVTTMQWMFVNAKSFNQPIGNWNTGKVTTMESMFEGAASFNQPIGNWDTGNVTTMKWMLHKAAAFNQPIGNWNIGNVNNIEGMFTYAGSFNQPINSWNTANVTAMAGTFAYATAFNQPLNNWNTGKVTTMQWMFEQAKSFNQGLGMWNITNVANMGAMLSYSGLSTSKYDATLLGWAEQPVKAMVTLGADGLTYCRAEDNGRGRKRLTQTYLWTIIGDQKDCWTWWCINCRTVADTATESGTKTYNNETIADHEEIIQVYPNPAVSHISLKTVTGRIHALSLTDMLGNTVFSQEKPVSTTSVSVSHLATGIYILRCTLDDKRSYVQKVAIAR